MRQSHLRSPDGTSPPPLLRPGRSKGRLRRYLPRRPSCLPREKSCPHRHDRNLPHMETRYARTDPLLPRSAFPRHCRLRRFESSRSQLRRPRTGRILLPRSPAPRRSLWRKRRIPHLRLRRPDLSISHSRSNRRHREPRRLYLLRSITPTGGSNKMNTKMSQKENLLYRTLFALALIVLAAALRIAPHPWNFTPVGAMALFAGAMLRDPRLAFVFPLFALFAGD